MVACLAFAAAVGIACGQDGRLRQHAKAIASLQSTTTAIAQAWLSGQVSATYARTALDATFRRVEQERRALADSPQSLADARVERLVSAAERLSRHLATLGQDVDARNVAAARRHLADAASAPLTRR